MKVVLKEGYVLDRLLRRYVWIELIFGILVLVLGIVLGGPILPALGGCMVALAAQCSVHSEKHHWAVIALGLISLLVLAMNGISSFLHLTSLSGYADDTSPLTVLFALAVILLGQSFLALPVEDRSDLAPLRRGISVLTAFAAIGFAGIILTYILSYVLFGSAVAAHLEGETVQDFHYLEGIFALAMTLTGARAVFRAYLGREHLTDRSQEENNDKAA